MPPPSFNKKVTPEELAVLKQWINEGAKWEDHWAFVPPQRPAEPDAGDGWAKTPVDRFIAAKQRDAGLAPSPPADPHTLIRRVYLDLIGLPPTPAQADAFAADPSDAAYAATVDRLLQSERYGERWARRWLDLARYADTNGYEKDRDRSIWPYRDWVIRALNDDMPFDQFTVEQIAGDLLPDATLDQLTATGFHRNTMLNEEGGIDPLEFRYHAMVDRVATTGTTWLGLTIGCAQCHTHKYDPITHEEYFQMFAFLNNADEPDQDLVDPEKDAAYQLRLLKAEALAKSLPDLWPAPGSGGWESVPLTAANSNAPGDAADLLPDGSALFAGPAPEKAAYVIEADLPRATDTLRLSALAHDKLPSRGPGRTKHGNFVLTEVAVEAGGKPVPIASAAAEVAQPNFPAANAADGDAATGWAVHDPAKPLNADRAIDLRLAEKIGGKVRLTLRMGYGNQHLIGRPALAIPAAAPKGSAADPEKARRDSMNARLAAWLAESRAALPGWRFLRPAKATSNLPLLTVQPDDSVFASGDTTKQDTYELTFADLPGEIGALRLEAMPDKRLPAHGPGMTFYEGRKGDFFLGEFEVIADGKPVKIASAAHTYANNQFGNNPATAELAADGDFQTGWSTAGHQGERDAAAFRFAEPLRGVKELTVRMTFGRHFASSLGRFRLSASPRTDAGVSTMDAEAEALLAKPGGSLSEAERAKLTEVFLLEQPEMAAHAARLRELRKPPSYPHTLVMRERPPENPRPTFIHNRGEFTQPTDPVDAGVPEVLHDLPADAKRDRLAFARWLVARDNPLTARVAANRAWAAFFGKGIVRTVDDFGFQGELPTHPELLDWLAVDFMESGWSLKHLHRLIVTSAVYRQSAEVDPESLAKDADNRWLARAPRNRLEAEIIRDAALHASGLLSEKMFGPPVRPPQPEGVTEVAYGSPKWNPSQGEDRYRRSIYTYLKRTAPFAMFTTFDAPSGEACIARRDRSNSPLQALTLLNDGMFLEAAQALGSTIAAQKGTADEKAADAFRRILIRQPTDTELEKLVAFYQAQKQRFASGDANAQAVAGEGQGNPIERAAWTAAARALMNLDEAVTRG
ncbi:MAG: DUF1549 and DUF1553 domain-containing protein [Verrucomicrobiales bacterium]